MILNPLTKRYVKITGRLGRRLCKVSKPEEPYENDLIPYHIRSLIYSKMYTTNKEIITEFLSRIKNYMNDGEFGNKFIYLNLNDYTYKFKIFKYFKFYDKIYYGIDIRLYNHPILSVKYHLYMIKSEIKITYISIQLNLDIKKINLLSYKDITLLLHHPAFKDDNGQHIYQGNDMKKLLVMIKLIAIIANQLNKDKKLCKSLLQSLDDAIKNISLSEYKTDILNSK
jgi:hypothetical protein